MGHNKVTTTLVYTRTCSMQTTTPGPRHRGNPRRLPPSGLHVGSSPRPQCEFDVNTPHVRQPGNVGLVRTSRVRPTLRNVFSRADRGLLTRRIGNRSPLGAESVLLAITRAQPDHDHFLMNRLVAMNIDEWTEDNVHSSSLGGIRGAARSAERSAKVNVAGTRLRRQHSERAPRGVPVSNRPRPLD